MSSAAPYPFFSSEWSKYAKHANYPQYGEIITYGMDSGMENISDCYVDL